METPIRKNEGLEGFGEAGLREVLGLELQAKAMLKEAQADARRIVAEAGRQAEELKAAMTAKANQEAETATRESQLKIEEQVHLMEEETERQAEDWEQIARAHFEETLAFVLDTVTMGEVPQQWS